MKMDQPTDSSSLPLVIHVPRELLVRVLDALDTGMDRSFHESTAYRQMEEAWTELHNLLQP